MPTSLHRTTLRVRTYECDAYGHVNNAVYLNYLEFARDRFLEDRGLDYQALVASGFGIWVAEAHLTYLAPALPGEELSIETAVKELGAASVVLGQTVRNPEKVVLEGTMKLVWVGPGGRPTRIPADWRTKFSTGA